VPSSRVLASVVAACSFAVAAAAIVLGVVADRSGATDFDFAQTSIYLVAVVAPVVVGLVLALRGVAPSIAWVLLLGALGVALAGAAEPYADVALVAHPGLLPGGTWAAAFSDASWPLFFACPLFLAFLFPDGRLVSPAWRPVAWAAA